MLARRILEQAHERADKRTLMLALDWEKAFDSVAPEKLFEALKRFGVPSAFVDVIVAIYSDRWFFVR